MKLHPERALYEKRLTTLEAAKPKAQRIIQVFSAVSMRKGHPGLSAVAREKGVDVAKLQAGEYVVFINANRNALKIYACNNVVAHFKMPEHAGRMDLRTIALIPRCFSGTKFDYTKALRETIATVLTPK